MSRKVLIVDKSLYTRMILRDMLSAHGYTVLEASSGRDAVEMYKSLQPDLVTVDAMMPGMDGVFAVREIRFFDPKAAIFMCGTRGQRQFVMEGMSLGAEGVLLKPFNERQVLRAINAAGGTSPMSQPMEM